MALLKSSSLAAPFALTVWILSGCVLPTSTSSVDVSGSTITPAATVFGIVSRPFEQFIGGNRTEDVAIVLLGDRACDDIPVDCAEAPASGPHVALEIVLDESLFGDTQLGDYELPSQGSWTAQLEDNAVFAQAGEINLLAIDDARLVATYDVEVTGEERVVGDVVAEQCAAWEENRSSCE